MQILYLYWWKPSSATQLTEYWTERVQDFMYQLPVVPVRISLLLFFFPKAYCLSFRTGCQSASFPLLTCNYFLPQSLIFVFVLWFTPVSLSLSLFLSSCILFKCSSTILFLEREGGRERESRLVQCWEWFFFGVFFLCVRNNRSHRVRSINSHDPYHFYQLYLVWKTYHVARIDAPAVFCFDFWRTVWNLFHFRGRGWLVNRWLVSWFFEASQPLGITSGLIA